MELPPSCISHLRFLGVCRNGIRALMQKSTTLTGVYRVGARFRIGKMSFHIIAQEGSIKDINVREFFDRPEKQRSKNDMLLVVTLDSIYI